MCQLTHSFNKYVTITYHAVRVVLSVITKAQPLACSNQLSQETYNITSPNEKTMEEVRDRQ